MIIFFRVYFYKHLHFNVLLSVSICEMMIKESFNFMKPIPFGIHQTLFVLRPNNLFSRILKKTNQPLYRYTSGKKEKSLSAQSLRD